MTKILIDASQVIVAACTTQLHEDFSADNPDAKGLAKHIALNTILQLKKKFQGDVIICCDGRNYWRKQEFPWYKGHRKHSRSESKFDWTYFYEVLNELLNDLREHFPYTVIQVDGAEADDVIGILVKYYQENELVSTGLIDEPVEIVICSSDGDFAQLQKYRNVKQWNNVTKKFVKCANPKEALIEKIVRGDTGDNFPNILTPTQWSIDRANAVETRQVSFKTARMVDFYKKFDGACLNEAELINFRRNEKLADFDMIPESIQNGIIKAYIDYEKKGNKARVMNYLLKNRMKLLMKNATDF